MNNLTFKGKITYAKHLSPNLVRMAEKSHMASILGDSFSAEIKHIYDMSMKDYSVTDAVMVTVKKKLPMLDKLKLWMNFTTPKKSVLKDFNVDMTSRTLDDMTIEGKYKLRNRLQKYNIDK